MIGIIGAMDIEVQGLKEAMKQPKIQTIAGMNFFEGDICGKEVVVVKCGIGKVNAALCTQILVSVFNADCVINTGVAGSLNNDIDICDIVVSSTAVEHDMDVTPLGYEKGIIPGLATSEFEADKKLVELAKESAKKASLDVNVFEGKVVSGDCFVATHEAKEILRSQFQGDCAEMEGAAVAHTAYLNQIPFLIIRAISDKADGGAHMDYPTFEKKAAENSIHLMKEFLAAYQK